MTSPDAPVSNGLVAWYRLDEDLANTNAAFDSSGNNRHGAPDSVYPMLVQDRHGALGAQEFDGAATAIQIPTGGAVFDLASFTIAAWFYPQASNTNPFQILVSRAFGTSTANSFALDVAGNGVLEYYSQPDNSIYGVSTWLVNQWQHAALTYDGATKRLYYMGALEAQGAPGQAITYDDHPITIGCDISGEIYAYFFEGRLDDIMIFNRALSDTELAELAAFP